ncbi:MAG: site-specific integrase [Actinobacteria bacterium]|nr:site-specific integrase [Actinomycetota bacterium]
MDGLTLGEYIDEWLDVARLRLAPTTLASYAGMVRRYLHPALGAVPIAELTTRRIERTYAELLTRGGQGGKPLSPRSVEYCHAILHTVLADAVKHGVVVANPATGATVPRHHGDGAQAKDLTVWTAEELARFLELVADDPLFHLWALAATTGMRRGELLAVAWPSVDLDRRVLHVRHSLVRVDGAFRLKPPKNGRARSLALDDWTLGVLADRQEVQQREARVRDRPSTLGQQWELVFTTPEGEPLDPLRVTWAFRKLVASLPLPRIRLHDLRHGHATLLLQEGTPIKVVSDRLGHASARFTLDVYAHALPVMDAAAADRFAQLLGHAD